MLEFRTKRQPSKVMYLLEVYEEGKDSPVDSIYFENAEKVIKVVKDNLTDSWMKEYHPKWDDQFINNLTAEKLLHNDYNSRGAVLDLEKNERYSDPSQWLQANVFESLPKKLRLVITVVDVYY